MPQQQPRPRRLTVTVPQNVYDALEARSTAEGRSLSNLAAFMLEAGLRPVETPLTLPRL